MKISFPFVYRMGWRESPNGELLATEGVYLRIAPQVKWSMGVDKPAFQNGKPVIKKIMK